MPRSPGAPLRRSHAAPPVGLVHLGLGAFARAHLAAYTDDAADAGQWGIAGYAGRGTGVAERLAAQDGLYTLVVRGDDADDFSVVRSVVEARPAGDHEAWLAQLASPAVRVLTTTVTEAGYRSRPGGGLDRGDTAVQRDVDALRQDPRALVHTAPARIAAGLLARRASGAGALTVVPCDNLPANGAVLAGVVSDLLAAVSPSALEELGSAVSFVSTVVDRITPATTPADQAAVLAGTGLEDGAPVVTEPFREWVLAGEFPSGRPAWESAGALFVPDVEPYERRKLWLLNGGHSTLACLGLARGLRSVDEALSDAQCRDALERWWAVAAAQLGSDPAETTAYLDRLRVRFSNRRLRHGLAQIATDGSQKLPVRLLPVLRARRTDAAVALVGQVVAGWIAALRSAAPPGDTRADELAAAVGRPDADAVPRVLGLLGAGRSDGGLADDEGLVAAVRTSLRELAPASSPGGGRERRR